MQAHRIAVFSDVHGNVHALRAVLRAIQEEAPFDAVVAAGDLCLGGSDPAGCIELLQAHGVLGVCGNTDEYILSPDMTPRDDLHRSMWAQIRPAVLWVRAQLSREQFRWLEDLAFERSFSPTSDPADDLLVVHANPKNLELMILPSPEEQVKLWGEVRQPDDDPDLVGAMQDVTAQVVAFGHFHYTFTRRWEDHSLVDVAPCSMPGIDHDRRARYTVFERKNGAWAIQPRWVTYGFEKEAAGLRASDMPNKENFLAYFD